MIKSEALELERDEVGALVARNFRQRMKAERWSGRAFATALALPAAYVQRRMSGDSELSATDLKVFGDKLGMRVQDFFREPEPETKD